MNHREGLRFGPLEHCVHLCVDMQRLFHDPTPWHTPWMERVLPATIRLVAANPNATVFTRFIPLARPEDGRGSWRRYYERWAAMTLEALDHSLLDLVPPLDRFAPPALIVDKRVYSPWTVPALSRQLEASDIHTLIISGAETDVCVSATVTGAVDRGYRVVLPVDALCSSSDIAHEAILDVYRNRFSLQVELASASEIIESWVS